MLRHCSSLHRWWVTARFIAFVVLCCVLNGNVCHTYENQVTSVKIGMNRKWNRPRLIHSSTLLRGGSIHDKALPKFTDEEDEICVRKIFRPRPKMFNIFIIMRCFSCLIFFYFLTRCIASAGNPFNKSMMDLGFKPIQSHADDGRKAISFSSLDLILAKQVALNSGEMIPSRFMPEFKDLGSVLACTFFFCSTLLLPKWFPELDAAARFSTVTSFEFNLENDGEGASIDPNSAHMALIYLPKDERVSSNLPFAVKQVNHCDASESLNSDVQHDLFCHPHATFVEINERRIYFNETDGRCKDGGPIEFSGEKQASVSINYLLQKGKQGLSFDKDLIASQNRYGQYTEIKMTHSTLFDCFIERLSSPLSVMKLVANLTILLEEPLWRFLFETGQNLFNHLKAAKVSIEASKNLIEEVESNEKNYANLKVKMMRSSNKKRSCVSKKHKIVWRNGRMHEIVPGDVFLFESSELHAGMVMPVDALLLSGTCVCNEASLTGESVLQTKIPLDVSKHSNTDVETKFDMFGIHRGSVLFAGSNIIQYESQPGQKEKIKMLALRSGTYSCRGEMVRHLVKAKNGSISNDSHDRDTLRLILVMSLYGLVICSTFICESRHKVSSFRLIIQCTRILLASIPTSLPFVLASIVSECTKKLRYEEDVVCSTPGALIEASSVTLAIFDKTGTISADTQRLHKCVKFHWASASLLENALLASCHSLVTLVDPTKKNKEVVGDPLDLACLSFSGASFCGERKYAKLEERHSSSGVNGDSHISPPSAIWQLKSFAFDSVNRTSSSLVMILHADGHCRLWRMVKGAPDSIKAYVGSDIHNSSTSKKYDEEVSALARNGFRTISMAAKEVNPELVFGKTFWSSRFGDVKFDSSNEQHIREIMKHAGKLRKLAKSVNRSFVEVTAGPLDFVGFACFDACTRRSSQRVLRSIRKGGIRTCILTGDGLDAAISTGLEVGLITRRQRRKGIITIQVVDNHIQISKINSKLEKVYEPITKKALKAYFRKDYAVVAEGKVVSLIVEDNAIKSKDYIRRYLEKHLSKLLVVARATPQMKREFVLHVKHVCHEKTIMCGDGVNDVAAIKASDVGVALLSGYGEEQESDSSHDWEDERRRIKFRSEARKTRHLQGEAPINISHERIKSKVLPVIKKVQTNRIDSGELLLADDYKAVASVLWRAIKEEWRRSKEIRKGGGKAAQLIREDDQLRRSILKKSQNCEELNSSKAMEVVSSEIKAGEACLAASFTALRPSIDGVEGILRAGVSTSANSLSTRVMIVLESVLACYSLTALYKERVRYSKTMWPIGSAIISSVYAASSIASNTPLPTLTNVRPPMTILNRYSVISIVFQSLVHLGTLSLSVNFAKQESFSSRRKGFKVGRVNGSQSNPTFMGRPPFRPNLVTNVVYLLSVFQSAVIVMVNHQGRPFYRSVLESQSLTTSLGILVMFCILSTLELVPKLNSILELAQFSPNMKKKLLFLFFLDGVGSILSNQLSMYLFSHDLWIARRRNIHHSNFSSKAQQTAAEEEEIHLLQKRKDNIKRIRFYAAGFLSVIIFMAPISLEILT